MYKMCVQIHTQIHRYRDVDMYLHLHINVGGRMHRFILAQYTDMCTHIHYCIGLLWSRKIFLNKQVGTCRLIYSDLYSHTYITYTFIHYWIGSPVAQIGGLPYNNPNHSVTQPADSQADQDGSFGYSRLQEDRAAAAAESVYKPVAEVDAPNTDYAGAADPNGVSVDVASKDPAIMKVPPTDLNSESTM